MNKLNVLNKLDKKLTNFEGSVDRCINLAKRLQRIFLIERYFFELYAKQGELGTGSLFR